MVNFITCKVTKFTIDWSVPIHEVAWGNEDDVPTHIYIQFTSSHGGAYIGSPGNSLWVDNVKLVY